MRTIFYITVLIFTLMSRAAPALSGSNAGSPNGTARLAACDLMARVRAQLPDRPLRISGRLLSVSGRVGRPAPVCHVDMLLLLGRDPPTARYTISDLFGDPVERMTIGWNADFTADIRYEKGSEPSQAPDLTDAVRETGITWNDLTLAFLWRRDGRVVGMESIRGRDCVIVEFDQPQTDGVARIWIDNSLFMIIQAEEYDASGERIRRLSIKNIKKIGDTWMIKDMEVRSYPSMDRTLLRIDDVIHTYQDDDSAMP